MIICCISEDVYHLKSSFIQDQLYSVEQSQICRGQSRLSKEAVERQELTALSAILCELVLCCGGSNIPAINFSGCFLLIFPSHTSELLDTMPD